MADKKISQLSSASTPLAGTEVLPIVQSSTTVKVSADDLTVKNVRSNATTGILQIAGPAAAATRVMTVPDANFTSARTDAAQTFTGNQTLGTGNLVMGTADKGIDFSVNSSAAGMTSELLNDYEEGTWTPTLNFLVPGDLSVAYSTQLGRYTKIGRKVSLQFTIITTTFTWTTASSILYIQGLPFPASNVTNLKPAGIFRSSGITGAGTTGSTWAILAMDPNESQIYLQASAFNGGTNTAIATWFTSGTNINMAGSIDYITG